MRDAINTSASDEWLFPKSDGTQHPDNINLVNVIRSALRKANKVSGYVHKCRRKGCGYSEEAADDNPRRCPKCQMNLWTVGKVGAPASERASSPSRRDPAQEAKRIRRTTSRGRVRSEAVPNSTRGRS